jgi:uncharacterized RDD family membrane protein YckC
MMRAMMAEPFDFEEPVVPLAVDSAGDTRVVGLRGLQYALDLLVALLCALVVAVAMTFGLHALLGVNHLIVQLLVFAMVWFWLAIILMALAQVWWPYRHGGRTPAMGWCRLRIVMRTGEEPPLSAYVVRYLLMIVDGFVFGLVGLAIMANSRQQQRVGDMVASTLVVREPR